MEYERCTYCGGGGSVADTPNNIIGGQVPTGMASVSCPRCYGSGKDYSRAIQSSGDTYTGDEASFFESIKKLIIFILRLLGILAFMGLVIELVGKLGEGVGFTISDGLKSLIVISTFGIGFWLRRWALWFLFSVFVGLVLYSIFFESL